MKKQKQIIPVFFSVDDNYVPLLNVAIYSLKKNASKNYIYNVHILNTGLTLSNIELLKGMQSKNTNILFNNISNKIEAYESRLFTRDYYSRSTYYRFFIADFFPQYNKALYLDSDIIIKEDISKLYNTELGTNLVGAINDDIITNEEAFSEYTERALGISRYNYFNAGILVMNLYEFRQQKVLNKFFDLLNKYTFTVAQDQDYLNVICKNKVTLVSEFWNKTPMPNNNCDKHKVSIIHFKIVYRPWHCDNVIFANDFWRYAKRTQSYKALLQIKKNYSNEQLKNDYGQLINLKQMARDVTKEFEQLNMLEQLYA